MRTLAALLVATLLAGCGSSPTTPATDPESIKRLEELQKQAVQGEGKGGEGEKNKK